jgi:hypothetical protein
MILNKNTSAPTMRAPVCVDIVSDHSAGCDSAAV